MGGFGGHAFARPRRYPPLAPRGAAAYPHPARREAAIILFPLGPVDENKGLAVWQTGVKAERSACQAPMLATCAIRARPGTLAGPEATH